MVYAMYHHRTIIFKKSKQKQQQNKYSITANANNQKNLLDFI